MAKGDPTLEGTRLLRKLIPGVEFQPAVEDTWTLSSGAEGWKVVNNGALKFAVWRGYFDISGLSIQDLSLMVAAPGWQECDEWFLDGASPGSRPLIKTWDILSKAALRNDILSVNRWVNPGVPCGWNAPGMMASDFNLEEIFSGRYRTFTEIQQTTIGPDPFLSPIAVAQSHETAWGAGDATAGDKLHITRIVLLSKVQLEYPQEGHIIVPPMSVIVPVALVKEKNLVHMERLRRSYVEADVRS